MKSGKGNRTKIFIGIILFNILLIGLVLSDPRVDINSLGFWLSLIIGVGLGVLSCLYLRVVWDPVQLELKNKNAHTADFRWMPIAVIGGIVFAKFILEQLNPEIGTALANIGLLWAITLFSYMGFQAWWHRLK